MRSNQVSFDEDNSSDVRVWEVTELDEQGEVMEGSVLVTFDRETVLNLWHDYPNNFTEEQIKILKEDLPFWYKFFDHRLPTQEESSS